MFFLKHVDVGGDELVVSGFHPYPTSLVQMSFEAIEQSQRPAIDAAVEPSVGLLARSRNDAWVHAIAKQAPDVALQHGGCERVCRARKRFHQLRQLERPIGKDGGHRANLPDGGPPLNDSSSRRTDPEEPTPAMRWHPPRAVRAALDAFAFSSGVVATAAGLLCAAASLSMGLTPLPAAVAVAVAGTLVVYNVDRLRDLERDHLTAPDRSAFVARHRRALGVLTATAGVGSLACAAALGPWSLIILAPVAALGLAHRRLKGIPLAKAAYITLAWLAVSVALPAMATMATTAGHGVAWVAGILGLSIFANAIASNARDREGVSAYFGRGPALHTARAVATLGIALAAVAPAAARPLGAVGATTLLALIPFRAGERYGLLAVDGALVLGAALAIGWL